MTSLANSPCSRSGRRRQITLHMCDHAGTRGGSAEPPWHKRPATRPTATRARRLLRGVLPSGPLLVSRRLRRPSRSRHGRAGGHDERGPLRPLAQDVLPELDLAEVCTSAVQRWPRRTRSCGRPGAGRDREPEPKRGDPQGHVPPIAIVVDRDQARERRAQGLGQLTAQAASPAGRVLGDPFQELPAPPQVRSVGTTSFGRRTRSNLRKRRRVLPRMRELQDHVCGQQVKSARACESARACAAPTPVTARDEPRAKPSARRTVPAVARGIPTPGRVDQLPARRLN